MGKDLLLMGRRNITVDEIILYFEVCPIGNNRTQFSVKYDAVCGCDLFFASIVKLIFHSKKNRAYSLVFWLCFVLFFQGKRKKSEGIKCFYMQNDLRKGGMSATHVST